MQILKHKLHVHVTNKVCELRHCGWAGFHFHWRHRRYRTAFDGSLTPTELAEFDADCRVMEALNRREVIPDG